MNCVYIHYYNVEGARPIYNELINAIQSNGLYERVERIVVNVVGLNHIDTIKDLQASNPEKIIFTHHRSDDFINHYKKYNQHDISRNHRLGIGEHGLEIDTLDLLHHECINFADDDCVLYVHLKGTVHKGAHLGSKYQSREHWRKAMSEHVITEWRSRLESIQTNNHAGLHFKTHPKPHYSGNYWWVTAKYIKNNLPVYDMFMSQRLLYDVNPETTDYLLLESPYYFGEFWLCNAQIT